MRARLIVNPSAGADRALTLLPRINDRLRTLITDLDITIATGEQDAIRAATRAAREECDAVYVAGGDGTLNAVVRGLTAVDGAFDRLAIGVIPCGTGNDFAKALGLGEDPEAALERLLEPTVADVDLGSLNDRAFVNTSAGGFVADVSVLLTEGLKDATGKLAYIIGGARALFGTQPFMARVNVGEMGATGDIAATLPQTASWYGKPIDVQMFAVCNARFIGGGYPIAPGAFIDDGLLDVYVVPRTPTLEFIGVLQRIAAGNHHGDERVLFFRAREVELVFDRPVHVNTDGEVLGVDRCRYDVRPRAARFFCGDRPQISGSPRRFMI